MQLSQKELEKRIALDFNKNLDDILLEIRQIYPDVSERQIENWEKSRALEFMEINGEKRYFRRAARNLFRIDKEAKQLYIEKFGDEKQKRNDFLKNYLTALQSQEPRAKSQDDVKHFTFTFRLKVEKNAVPNGEIIRCWLPFPRQDVEYQRNIKLISVNSDKFQISENSVHSSIYFEKTAKKNEETIFEVKYSFETQAFVCNLHHKTRRGLQTRASAENAKKIFAWVSENIVWAAAREYSTLENIPQYVLENRHGDCGQAALLFISLCQQNGIPARWLSGFMLHPNCENLHDWAEIFIENFGWLPVDVSFGLQRWAETDDLRYFYFGNMDAFRLIINNGISGEFSPKKEFERSETIDFQRGEVEWRGGNLYFDKWNYEFLVEENC